MNPPSIILPERVKIEKLRSNENSKLVNIGFFLIDDTFLPTLMMIELIFEMIGLYDLKKIVVSYSSGKKEGCKEWTEFCQDNSFQGVKIYYIPEGLRYLVSYSPKDKKDSEEVKEVLDEYLSIKSGSEGRIPSNLTRFISKTLKSDDIEDILTDVNKFYFIKGVNKYSCDYKFRSQHIYSMFENKKFVEHKGIDTNIFSEVYLNHFGYISSVFDDIQAVYFNSDFMIQ